MVKLKNFEQSGGGARAPPPHALHTFRLWFSLCLFAAAKRMLILELKLTMEPAYRNFYSSSFAQPLPEAQQLQAMNAIV